jgi:hypothetical protein
MSQRAMSEMPTYVFDKGFTAKVDAQVLGAVLEKLEREKGAVTPHDLVEEARPEDHPLHDDFTWDDTEAGQKWRLHEARQLIAHVRVEKGDPSTHEPVQVRAFVNVVQEEKRGYTNRETVLSDAELRQQVLDRALGELRSWRLRYIDYEDELREIFAVIERVVPAPQIAAE